MVRIISAAPHPSVVREVICKHCGATLEYVPADIKEKTISDYTGGTDILYFIKCPSCGTNISVKKY